MGIYWWVYLKTLANVATIITGFSMLGLMVAFVGDMSAFAILCVTGTFPL